MEMIQFMPNRSTHRHVAYSPISDAMTLRRLLLRVLPQDIQLHFHALEASRTPDEWIQREADLHYNISAWRFPGSSPHCFRMYCPACRAAMPRPSRLNAHGQDDDPVFQHIAGIAGQDPCPVIAEVLHMVNTIVRPGRFSDEAIKGARRAFEHSKGETASEMPAGTQRIPTGPPSKSGRKPKKATRPGA